MASRLISYNEIDLRNHLYIVKFRIFMYLYRFNLHSFLPYYYHIRGKGQRDGFTYVTYINGGHQPWTLLYPFYKTFQLVFIFEIFYKK